MWRFEAEKAGPIEAWLSGPAVGLGAVLEPAGEAQERDLYADTEECAFHRAGMALRVRRTGGRLEAAMVPLRLEATEADPVPVSSEDPASLKRVPDPLGARVRAVAGPRELRPVLLARTRRRAFLLRIHGRRSGDLEIEETTARRAGDGAPSVLVRVGLRGDDPADPALLGFVAAMQAACGVAIAKETVYASALERLGVGPPAPRVSGPVSAARTAPVGVLAYAVLRRHLAAFLQNEPGTRLGDDPEALHDMRVASRRLRAAIALYADVLPVRAGALRRRLGRIGRALGEVRDLDVQLEQLDEFVREAPAAERLGMQAYLATVVARRDVARRKMLRVLDSRGYARLVESLVAFVEREPRRWSPEARRPALAAAPELLLRRYRKARRIGDLLTPTSPPSDWHALRIALKRLRYAVEFHAELYGEEARQVIEALAGLQDLLGLHQDAQVAMAHLEDMCGPRGRRLAHGAAFAMGRVAQKYAQRAEDLRREFPKLYRPLRRKRWRRLRQAMGKARPLA